MTVDDPVTGSVGPGGVVASLDSLEQLPAALASASRSSFVSLLRRLHHGGLVRELRLPVHQYRAAIAHLS